MAQITVPGSTAESTNVTPVSAEVPTGVTLPEQIGDFTAQTNAAEPSGPTVDAAQDLPIEQPEWNYFDDQYEIRRMAADALDRGDSQKAIRVAALAEHYNRSQLEVELNLDREEKRLQREQTETLLADLPTSSRYFQENPLEAPIFKNDLKPLALMEKQFGRLGSAQSWKPEIDPHTKPSGTFSREKPLRLGDDESTGDEELDERIQLVKRPGDYLSDTVGHLGDWYKVGTLQTEQGLLWNRARQGFTRIDEHLLSEDRRLESEMKTLTGDAEGNAIYEAAVVVGQMISSMFSGSGIEGAAKGAAVGGMSASVIPGIGTVAGLVGGSALGAATQSTFDVEAGSSYRDMYMAKVDPAAARWLSTGAGAVNSLIEMVGIKVLGSAAKPLLGTLMTKYGAKTVNAALATPTMGTVLKHAALAYAGGVGEEVATEVMQEGVNMASEEIARLYANGNFDAVNGEALFDRLSEIAWKTLQATAVLGALGGGAAVGVGAHKVHRANQTKEFFETAAQAVPQMASIQTAPNKIQALIARQADAAGAPTTYIDGAEFRQAMIDQNVSMTDLRQIAPEVADQVEAAADLGVDVEVSTSEYATKFASTPLGQRLTDHVRLAPDALSVADLIKVDQARKDLMKQIVKASFDGNEQKLADRFLDSVENRQWRQESSRIEKMLAAQIHTVAPHFQKAEVLTQARLGASMVTLLAQRSGLPIERIGQIMPSILAEPQAGSHLEQVNVLSPEDKLAQEVAAWSNLIDQMQTKPSQPVLMLKQTPLVMHLVGADFHELKAHPHVFDGFFPWVERSSATHHSHPEMTREVLKQLPTALADPIAIFKDDRRQGSYTFMLELLDAKGKTVVVPIQFEAQGYYGTINLVKTAFGKKNDLFFSLQEQNDAVVYANTEKIKRWNLNSRTNPFRGSNASGNRVLTEDDLVKAKEAFPGFYQAVVQGQDEGTAQMNGTSPQEKLAQEVAAWGKQIDQMQSKPTQPVLMLKQTPLVMHLVGADFHELKAHPHVFDGLFPEAKRSSPNHNSHREMTRDVLRQIPAALADPIAVFKDDRRPNSFVFMVDVQDTSGKTVIVPIAFEAHGANATINLATTAYGKDSSLWFELQINNGAVRYVNQEKMRQWNNSNSASFEYPRPTSGSNSLFDADSLDITILTEDDLVKAKEAFPGLYQESNAGQRGSFSPLTNTIALTPNADLSTFAHEMSHWYLANLIEFSKLDGVDISVTEDVETLLKEFGLKDVAQWDALGFEGQRKFHERFAYQAEVYLSTGHAPTRSLERFFARFASWIKSVYLQWSGDARAALSASYQAEFGEDLPDISPDMKRVFDRMLVAQRDLDLAESANGLKPLFDQKPEDMPEDQWRELMAARDEATAQGEVKLFEAQAKDEKWYVNARLRSARRIDREAKDYRDRVEEKVRARINARKEFAAFDALKSGGKVFGIENLKIAPESLDGLGLKPAVVAKLQKLGLTKKLGFPITAARQLLQPIARFKTNEQLVAGLIAGSKDREKIIQDETSRICLENKSNYFDPVKKEELIEKAIHSEARGRMVATELKYLAGDKTMSARVIREAARQVALERFEQMRAGKINPKTFMAAESRASREAYSKLVAGDRLGAAMAKRRQLLNHEFALMAIDFKRTMDHLSDLRKQIFKSDKELAKTRDIDVIAVARYILNASGFGRIHPKDMNANALEKTIEKFKNNDANKFEEYKAILAPYGYSPGRNYDWRTYAVADVRAILQQVNDFWKKAGDDRAVLLHGRRKNLTEVVDELVTHIDNGKDIFSAGANSAVTPMEKLRFHYLGWKASMMRVESWCRIMDGGRAGIFSKYIYQPVENAVVRYKNENMEYQRRFGEILQSAEKEWGQSDAIEAPEINYTFNTKAELMGAILHTGNASNKRKLLLGGRGIDDNNVRHAWAAIKERDDGTQYVDTSAWDSFINRMYVQGRVTKADMDAVQAIWDLLEETKPKAQAAYMEMYGYRFEEVQATSVVTPFGTYRGGYVPAVTDRYLYQKRDAQMKQEELERSNFLTLMPVHKPGFSKTRVEDFTQPLQLNVAAYGMHIAKVLRFADIAPAVMQVDKIITNHRFQDAIAAHNPRLVSQMLKPFLTRAVGQTVSDGKIGWVDRTFNHLRGLAGMNVMFLNLINTFQQWTGFSIAASKVPASLIGRAFKEYGLAPKECAEFVKAASPFMRQRLDNFAYEYQSTIEEIGNQQVQKISQVQGLGNKAAAVWSKGAPVRDMVNRHGYILQTLAQYPIDVSVWKAAYEYNYSHGMSHEEAVQEADSVIRTTQSDFNPENVSAIEAGSALKRFFLVFYNYFNMQYNLLQERAAFRKATKQYGRFALDAILIVWIPSVVGKLITDALMGGGDDDDDDALDALDIIQLTVGEPLKGTISMVPLAGQISAFAGAKMAQAGSVTAQAIWGKSPYVGRVGSAPAIMLMEGAISGASDIVRIINDDEKVNGRTAARNILDLTAVATGMPVGGLKRPIGYIAGVASGDIDEPETALQAVRGLVGGK